MLLPKQDAEFLSRKGFHYEVTPEGGVLCLVIENYSLPTGYEPSSTSLLLRLPPSYPDGAPDMFWCNPAVRIQSSGAFPVAADQMEPYLGQSWQRFSRHFTGANVWVPGRDSLETYLTLIRGALEASLR